MKYFTVLISNFLLLFVLLPINSSSQEKLDLFIWAGQSNAQGWMGDAANYPEDGSKLDESILLNWTFVDNESSGGKWVRMQPQEGRFPKGHFGPEVSFARELKKAGYNPAIFKYTKGATGLSRDWKAPGQRGIYDHMVEDLKSAIKKLEKQGFKVTLRGFLWIQGETDAGGEQAAKDYYHNLEQLINDLRKKVLHKPDLKVILGVDEQHQFVKERPVVVEAQKRLAEEDESIVFTSMLGLPKADATHLTPAGLVEQGKRIFKAYLDLKSDSTGIEAENDSVGLTSEFPIHLKEKMRSGLHHGALHCQTAGIDFLVVHLHPGSIKRRIEEAEVLNGKLNALKEENSKYIVLGDFNAHSPFDAHLYNPDGYSMNRLRKSQAGKGINGNIFMNDLDYSVIASFLAFPLYDVIRKNTTGM